MTSVKENDLKSKIKLYLLNFKFEFSVFWNDLIFWTQDTLNKRDFDNKLY